MADVSLFLLTRCFEYLLRGDGEVFDPGAGGVGYGVGYGAEDGESAAFADFFGAEGAAEARMN